MSIFCTLKRPEWDSNRQAEYEILRKLAYAATLRLAHPTGGQDSNAFTVAQHMIEREWEVLPGAEDHTWHETTDLER